MSDLWEPGPGPFEPFPDRSAEIADAMRQLQAAVERGERTMRRFHDWLFLQASGLDGWNDEMDNCYPNWPDS